MTEFNSKATSSSSLLLSLSWNLKELLSQQESLSRWSSRGGSSIIIVESNVVIFGGADREQMHFNDLIICRQPKDNEQLKWEIVETNGDIPTPRSGHAVASYGRFMFLYGGIDFSEEVVYNDLYTLNIETLEWKYVGEKGPEIPKRNSHSLMIVSNKGIIEGNEVVNSNYLVLYGGASPEEGVLGDSYYAVLPNIDEVECEEFYVNWVALEDSKDGPGPREMHCNCSNVDGSALIIGGRNEDGSLRSDVWRLRVPGTTSDSSNVLLWERSLDLEMPTGRCAHGSAIVDDSLCVYGGFTGNGIAGDLLEINLSSGNAEAADSNNKSEWKTQNCPLGANGRFGIAVCSAPFWIQSKKKNDSNLDNNDSSNSNNKNNNEVSTGFCLFGGVSVENDFGDIWFFCRNK